MNKSIKYFCKHCGEEGNFPEGAGGSVKGKCYKCAKVEMLINWERECPITLNEVAERYNTDKLRMDLIPPEADKMLAEVLTMGAKKYADRNWELGTFNLVRDIVGSMKRHLNSWEMGEDVDEESQLNHTKHILWNAMALAVYVERNEGVDDRPSKK